MKMTNSRVNLKNGQAIDIIKLTNPNKMEVEILTLGGIIKSIKTPDKEGNSENVLIEYEDINTYIENPGYINALIGRSAGRIHKAQFTLNNSDYKLAKNDGNNTLHGGIQGLDKRIWAFKDVSCEKLSAVELSYFSPDNEEGYPGNLEVKVTYSLDHENVFTIAYEAISDEDTLINLTNHGYFNLSGDAKRTIDDQVLMIKAGHVCELDNENIVTGKLLDVSRHTPFDFRTPKAIGTDIDQDHEQLNPRKGYDHPWVLEERQEVVTLYDPLSGRHMAMETDQKTVVVYSMNAANPSQFTNGEENIRRYGITFEAQNYPIGHNQCFKDDNVVLANEKYTQKTSFKFSVQ